LHGMDVPWHLKASYQVLDSNGKAIDTGTYEEWRAGDRQYRIALHSPSLSVEEFGTDHGLFRTGQRDWPGKPLSAIQTAIEWPVTSPARPEKTEFRNYERSFSAGKMPCTALIAQGADTTAMDAASYCFAATNTVVQYSTTPKRAFQTLFQNFVAVQGHYLAKDVQVYLAGKPWLNVHVDTITGLSPAGLQALAVPADAFPVTLRARVTGEVTNGGLVANSNPVKKAVPVYPSTAKLQGIQGTVILNGIIGTDGRFQRLQVLTGPPMLQQPALDAVRQWAYEPYLLNGQAIEVETDVNVVFVLGR
jgi:TonB family protein